MKNFLFSVTLALSLAFGSAVFAAEKTPVSFDNVTLTYQSTDLSVDKTDGAGLAFSKTLGDVLYVRADVVRADNTSTSLDTYRVGLGARLDFANNATAYGVAYGLKANVDYSTPVLDNLDSYGYGVEGGLRLKALNSLELRGGVASERLTRDASWETFGLVGATLNLTDSFAVVADARLRNDRNQYNIGLQYQF